MKDIEKNEDDLKNERSDQEELSQKALGNTAVGVNPDQNNNDILSTPKTSGTGGNNAAATPDSLIVHDDEEGEDRYEQSDDKDA